jgi:hypothetical protein
LGGFIFEGSNSVSYRMWVGFTLSSEYAQVVYYYVHGSTAAREGSSLHLPKGKANCTKVHFPETPKLTSIFSTQSDFRWRSWDCDFAKTRVSSWMSNIGRTNSGIRSIRWAVYFIGTPVAIWNKQAYSWLGGKKKLVLCLF